jgi:TolA-binding protein
MPFFRRCLLILSVLTLGGGFVFADSSSREQRAYAAAVAAFRDNLWSHAETNLFQFIKRYPDSTNAPSAILLLARAEFKQGAFVNAAQLLEQHKDAAGILADQYVYWQAESQAAAGNYPEASKTFLSVARDFLGSPLRLTAQIEAAAACAQSVDWRRAEDLLDDTNGIFGATERRDPANELVSRGRLLLVQARYAQSNYAGADAVLAMLSSQTLPPTLDWQRTHLYCQVKMAMGDDQSALAGTTNLLQVARLENNAAHVADGVALQAGLLEKLDQPNAALAVYGLNLTDAVPPASQQQAILKIAELAAAQKQYPVAEQSLDQFLAKFPDSRAADLALLTSGELYLKGYLSQTATTNQIVELGEAEGRFGRLLTTFTNSPLAGRAYLARGWCRWLAGNFSESLADFKDAVKTLPLSEDLAVAKFKVGDALFALGNFSGARANYQSVLDDCVAFPAVQRELEGRVLYQIVRASLALNDNAGAEAALSRLLTRGIPDEFAQSSALLFGESTVDPVQARSVFQKLKGQLGESVWRPQIDLAVARTFEQEQQWPAAVTNYEAWLKNFPTNGLVPQAKFALAQANFQAGNETIAFNEFSRFVTQFPTDDLAPQAQWWVADYFFRQGGTNYVIAEENYKWIFQNTNWQDSPLIYPAQLMAGRAAMGRQGYKDAVRYFTGLIASSVSDSNCPSELVNQARFAYGAVLMELPSADTNNPLANYAMATNVFGQVTGVSRPQAWGQIGDCAVQMGDYVSATNAYEQVFAANSKASISLRSEAQVGFGMALEKLAAQAFGDDQTNLLALARDAYLDVFYGANLRKDDAAQDAFWTKKAGLQALPLIQALGAADVGAFFDHMEKLFPQAKESLEKKRAASLPSKGNAI